MKTPAEKPFLLTEDVFINILDNSPDPVFVKDKEHRWVYVNHRFCEFAGWPKEMMLGKSDYDFFPKEQADVFWEKDELVFATGQTNENIEVLTDATGHNRIIKTRKSIFTDGQTTPFLVGTIRDITEISQLQKHEMQITRVLRELAIGGSLQHVLKTILEVAEEEFPGMTASLLVVNQETQRLHSVIETKLPAFFVKAIEGTPVRDGMGSCGTAAYRRQTTIVEDVQTHPYWQGVKEITQKAGLRACWSQPVIASNGIVVGTFALYYNQPKKPGVIELKLMETMAQVAAITIESLRREKDKVVMQKILANIIDSMPSILIGVDPRGVVTQWNAEIEKITGISRENALGKSLESIYPAMQVEMSDLKEALQTKKIHSHLRKVQDHSGEKQYEDVTIYPLQSNGMEGAVIRIDNVTKRVRLEEAMIQSDKMRSIGVLAGGIAHDFNNLLVGILGNLDLAGYLLEKNSKVYELIKNAEKASQRARGLTNQLLTFSKGGQPVRQAEVLGDIIEESSRFILSGSNVVCNYNIPDTLWLVNVDSGQISQVVQNLIINAKDAMKEGGVIEVRCANIDRQSPQFPPHLIGDRYVQVSIGDSGKGIEESHLGHIFEPYFSTKQEGSGLGLAVCHSIIQKHSGEIHVESEIGRGTRFIFYLPAILGNRLSPVSFESAPSPGSGKIMIMDDEEMVCKLAADMLAHLGYEVIRVSDGNEAIMRYEKELSSPAPIDLIIMDLTIPHGMGGKEAVQEILQLNSAAKVIVSSGYSTDPVIANYKEYGFVAALKKPFDIKLLSQIVHSILS